MESCTLLMWTIAVDYCSVVEVWLDDEQQQAGGDLADNEMFNSQYFLSWSKGMDNITLMPSHQSIILSHKSIIINITLIMSHNLPRGCAITRICLGYSSCNALKFYCSCLFFLRVSPENLICMPILLNKSLLLWYM